MKHEISSISMIITFIWNFIFSCIYIYITLPNNLQTKIWKKKKRVDILDFVVYIAIIYWYFEFVFLNFWFYNDLKINVNL